MNGKIERDRYVQLLARCAGAKIIYTNHLVYGLRRANYINSKVLDSVSFPKDATGIILAGVLRGNGLIFNEILNRKTIDYYYVDHAYFSAGYVFPNWMRVTKNSFALNHLIDPIDKKRWEANFNYPISNWKYKDKRFVTVLSPSHATSKVLGVTDWEEKTVNMIKNYTDRPIVIRKKDGPRLMDDLVTMRGANKYNYHQSLEEMIERSYCVVTYNSSAALKALMMGVPVICNDTCPAFPVSNKIEDIENLKEFDRLPLFSSLSWGRFTLKEAGRPKTWRLINNTYERKDLNNDIQAFE